MKVIYYYLLFDPQIVSDIKRQQFPQPILEQVLRFPQETKSILSGSNPTWKGYKFIWVRDPREVPKGSKCVEIRLCPRSKIKYYCLSVKGNLSCAVVNGKNIYINLDRWLYGSDVPGIPIQEYRRYVINHEMGHILGRLHPPKGFVCTRQSEKSPVMVQQSLALKGCQFNPYPLDYE